jgi:iron complex outermembrane receptor protein
MCLLRLRFSLLVVLFMATVSSSFGQQVIRGQVVDGDTGEPVFAAGVIVKGSNQGTSTDFDGRFRLEVPSLPVQINVSFIGYAMMSVNVRGGEKEIRVVLEPDAVLMEAAEVVGSRIDERQKQGPLTVESMDVLAIKEAPSGNFYEGLGNLKGVDLTSASLGFKIINTRGFNSTSPVRSLQLIDGVDNQSPGLNFSLGNFLGAPELDVMKVDIVAGASSAFYGPGAFNGVVSMETKSPFRFPGVSVSAKVGERNLTETGFRYADYVTDSQDNPVLGFKVNAFRFSADDWVADNYNPVDGTDYGSANPGGYDAVNVYGDEYRTVFDYSGDNSANARGLGAFYRTGYREIDLVDYETKNLKVSTALHLRLQPKQSYESAELVYGFNSGFGTTVYQGDNRFSLRDIEFYQHKIQLSKPGKWFVRAYRTSEDAGNSYDPYATALRLQENTRSDYSHSKVYYRYWVDSIVPGINATYPGLEQIGVDPNYGFPIFAYPEGSVEEWYADNSDSLMMWHNQVEQWANNGTAGLPDVLQDPLGYLAPGTPEFETEFNRLVAAKNNEEEGGTRFYDRSSLVHAHAERQFEVEGFEEVRIGANYRRYTPNSAGTIFSDTAGVVITNQEMGLYGGATKRLAEDKVILTASIRADKNQNFDWVLSPAASMVWKPREQDYLRVSFSSALRNPTLADQYLFLDVGPATLVGNLEGRENLVTISSFIDYRNSVSANAGLPFGNLDTLQYFDIAPIRPEQVKSMEVGYRTTLWDKLYLDGSWYYSQYNDFIGYNIGLDVLFQNPTFPEAVTGLDVYRYAANSINTVRTTGASIGANWYAGDHWMLSGNYSWNRLVKTDENDPIIPAFNTPEHKYNLGLSARDLRLREASTWGAGLNYKWVQGFVFEGSPQFTGVVPTFDVLDIQANARIDALNMTIKAGASNVLQNWHIEAYGGPAVGRLAYLSLLFEVDTRN